MKEVSEMSAREVLEAIGYLGFLSDYESAYMEMNR